MKIHKKWIQYNIILLHTKQAFRQKLQKSIFQNMVLLEREYYLFWKKKRSHWSHVFKKHGMDLSASKQGLNYNFADSWKGLMQKFELASYSVVY